jgi:hypothetical protein
MRCRNDNRQIVFSGWYMAFSIWYLVYGQDCHANQRLARNDVSEIDPSTTLRMTSSQLVTLGRKPDLMQ